MLNRCLLQSVLLSNPVVDKRSRAQDLNTTVSFFPVSLFNDTGAPTLGKLKSNAKLREPFLVRQTEIQCTQYVN